MKQKVSENRVYLKLGMMFALPFLLLIGMFYSGFTPVGCSNFNVGGLFGVWTVIDPCLTLQSGISLPFRGEFGPVVLAATFFVMFLLRLKNKKTYI